MKTKSVSVRERLSDAEQRKLESQDMYTTGDVAKICHVAPRTVSKWFDEGRIKGFRIPGSQDRRIPRDCLARFLETHEFGFTLSDPSSIRVLCVGFHQEQFDHIAREASGIAAFARASSGFAAGAMITGYMPTHVAIDLSIGRIDAYIIASGCKAEIPDSKIIGYGLGTDIDSREFDAIVFGAEKLLRAVMERKGGE